MAVKKALLAFWKHPATLFVAALHIALGIGLLGFLNSGGSIEWKYTPHTVGYLLFMGSLIPGAAAANLVIEVAEND